MPSVFEAASKNNTEELLRLLTANPTLARAAFVEPDTVARDLERAGANVLWFFKKIIGWTVAGGGALTAVLLIVVPPGGLLVGATIGGISLAAGGTGAAAAFGGDDQLAEYRFNRNGWTPLHFAAASDSLEAARILIRFGASIEVRDEKGRTPLDIAHELRGNKLIESNLFMRECRTGVEVEGRVRAEEIAERIHIEEARTHAEEEALAARIKFSAEEAKRNVILKEAAQREEILQEQVEELVDTSTSILIRANEMPGFFKRKDREYADLEDTRKRSFSY